MAAAVLAVFFLSIMYYVLNRKQNEIQELVLQKQEYEKTLNDHAQERAELAAYNEWEQSTIPWLDEMYDLTARYPYEIGFRVNQFNAKLNPVTAAGLKKSGKDGNFPGTINLAIVTPNSRQGAGFVQELEKSMVGGDPTCAGVDRQGPPARPPTRRKYTRSRSMSPSRAPRNTRPI